MPSDYATGPGPSNGYRFCTSSLTGAWALATADRGLLTFPAAKPGKPIDYVLFRPAGRLRATAATVIIDEPVASDHRPVLAVLEWGTNSRE